MCISSIIDFFQNVLRLACQRGLGQPITDAEAPMPKRKIEEEEISGTEISEIKTGQAHGPFLFELNDQVLLQIMSLLPGWMAWRLEATGLPAWRAGESWWHSRCQLEFSSRVALGSWRQTYRRLLGVKAARTGVWCYTSRRHGLNDRVAAPQLFVGPSGQKLFCYGGWSDGGPQNDLHWVSVDQIRRSAMDPSSEWQFQAAEDCGIPARAGGVQTLTPLWFGQDRPSQSHVGNTAQELQRGQAQTTGVDLALVMAFGGGGGGYRHEHNSWAVGVLQEGEGSDAAKILWGRPGPGLSDGEGLNWQPTPRCAHSATYIPWRFSGMDEGCVVIFGGHTAHCTQSLSTAEILCLNDWQWQPLNLQKSEALGEDWEMPPRHGHSATLFEVDGKGYVVVVGGGTGNILENWGVQDIGDVAVLAIDSWKWIGHYQLSGDTPGRHHTASRGVGNQLLVTGGGRRPNNKVCVLDAEACIQRAVMGDALGEVQLRPVPCNDQRSPEDGKVRSLPSGRKMHGAASLAPFAPLLVIYGGWKTGPHFSDLWTFAIGADASDLKDFEALEEAEEAEDSHDPIVDSPFVGVRMMGPDGQVRMMRIPSELLSQFVRQGLVRRAGPDPTDSDST